MTTFILLRHGQTDWNITRRYQGTTDNPLNETGIQQAITAREEMKKYRFDAVFSSDLYRVRQTAALALDGVFPLDQIQYDTRLRERSFGIYEGHSCIKSDVEEKYRIEMEQIPEDFKFPGGESLNDVADRIRPLYEEIRTKYPEQTVGIIAHGSLLSIFMMVINHDPICDKTRLHLENATPFVIQSID